MKASARRGRDAGIGLLKAWRVCQSAPDPIGLDNVRGNNRKALCVVAKLVFVMCDGRPGTRFFMGSVSVGMLFGKPHQTVLNWLRQLEAQGVIRRTRKGRPVKKNENGKPVTGGKAIDRASEYVFLGMPKSGSGD
jgi:hypothetical protein